MNEKKKHENIAISLIWDIYGRLLLVLKERKNQEESIWMLPGGHNKPNEEDLEGTAKRENVEETTLSGITGYHFLFRLEDNHKNHNRIFFVYEGFHVNIAKKINLPKSLLKEESIKKAAWFYLQEIEVLHLSAIATKIIKKRLSSTNQQTFFFHRSANRLQAILLDAQKSIKDKERLKEITREIKIFTNFLGKLQDEDIETVQRRSKKKE